MEFILYLVHSGILSFIAAAVCAVCSYAVWNKGQNGFLLFIMCFVNVSFGVLNVLTH